MFLISADKDDALQSGHYWGSPIIDDTLTLDITEVPHFWLMSTLLYTLDITGVPQLLTILTLDINEVPQFFT